MMNMVISRRVDRRIILSEIKNIVSRRFPQILAEKRRTLYSISPLQFGEGQGVRTKGKSSRQKERKRTNSVNN
jgi:hypothetical protein